MRKATRANLLFKTNFFYVCYLGNLDATSVHHLRKKLGLLGYEAKYIKKAVYHNAFSKLDKIFEFDTEDEQLLNCFNFIITKVTLDDGLKEDHLTIKKLQKCLNSFDINLIGCCINNNFYSFCEDSCLEFSKNGLPLLFLKYMIIGQHTLCLSSLKSLITYNLVEIYRICSQKSKSTEEFYELNTEEKVNAFYCGRKRFIKRVFK